MRPSSVTRYPVLRCAGMRRGFLCVALAALALLLSLPAAAQEGIVGQLEGGDTLPATGAMTIKGWALANTGVRQVIIQVDGQDIGAALLGRLRPTVTDLFPGYPDSAAPGFGFRLDTTAFPNGLHTVSAKVVTRNGHTGILPGTRDVLFNNNTSILVPFGAILRPRPNAQIFGVCNRNDPRRRVVPIEGWALDLGKEINDAGIGWVELMVDNDIFVNTRESCFFNLALGGFTQCYGLPLPAVERLYPFASNAPNAGFRFVLDIGHMISDLLYSEGQHLLTIRAGDISNQTADIDEIPVVFRCIEGIPNEGAFGRIESPREGLQYAGTITVQGWAVDFEGVDSIRISVDGELVGFADYGARDGIFDTRPGVFSRYPGFPDVEAPVFRMSLDTTQLSDGVRELRVIVKDVEGDQTIIGRASFIVDNMNDN